MSLDDLVITTPGVYWQAVFPDPAPLFLTGVPIFLGTAVNSETDANVPVPLHRWPQFEAAFGTPADDASFDTYLYYAVRGFFENGGTVCYVVRLNEWVDPDAEMPSANDVADGLTAVATVEENVDLICAPGITDVTLQGTILTYCEASGTLFAILDTNRADTDDEIVTYASTLDSSYGALYHPWITIIGRDGVTELSVPPCGHVAGIYAWSDQQVGVYKAPANEEMAGIQDLQTYLTKSSQTAFYQGKINVLRSFTGRGIRMWGSKTLSADIAWQYINVRRLLITIHRWLAQFMAEIPFEPNNQQLWIRIMREVNVYLNGLFQTGALKGQMAEQAYYVKCDLETNTQDVIDAGMVVTEIGVAAAVPMEFIAIRVAQDGTDVRITTNN